MLVLVLMLGIMTVPAVADKVDRDDVAYLMYADGSWKYSYWGDEAENGVKPINATVTVPENTRSASILRERKTVRQTN